MRREPSPSPPLLLLLLASVATITLYWNGLHGPMLLDDHSNLDSIHLEALDWQSLSSVTLYNHSGDLGRPVSMLSFALNRYFSGNDLFMLKYTNLMIHLLNGWLLFWLLVRLLPPLTDNLPHSPPQTRHLWAAAATASLWLIHPLLVSTVLYTVQRMTELSALFTLAALIGFVIGRIRVQEGRNGGIALMSVSLLLFGTLGALSKENAVLLPLYLLLIEVLAFRGQTARPADRRPLKLFYGLLVLLPLALGLGYGLSHLDSLLSGYDNRPFTLQERLMTEARGLMLYLRLILLPRLSALSLYRDDFPISHQMGLAEWSAVLTLLGLTTLAWVVRRRAAVLSFGIAWFLIAHLLESTLLPLELLFEHRNYLAAAGPLLIVVWYLPPAMARLSRRRLIQALPLAALMGLFLSLTFARVDTWKDRVSFVANALEFHPNSSRAYSEAAYLFLSAGDSKTGRRYLRQAIERFPTQAGPVLHLIFTYCQTEEPVPPSLLSKGQKLISQGWISSYAGIALFFLQDEVNKDQCKGLTAEQLSHITSAALSNPRSKNSIRRYFYHARLLDKLGKQKQAEALYEQAAFEVRTKEVITRASLLLTLANLQIELKHFERAYRTVQELEKIQDKPGLYLPGKITALKISLTKALDTAGLLNRPPSPSSKGLN